MAANVVADFQQTVEEQIADYFDRVCKIAVSPQQDEAAVNRIFDLWIASARGVWDETAAASRTYASNYFRRDGDISIWFTGMTSGVLGAAFANCTSGRAWCLDDSDQAGRIHPGAAVISTALAIAQEQDSSREEIIRAIVGGYEVAGELNSCYAVVFTAALLYKTSLPTLLCALRMAETRAPPHITVRNDKTFPTETLEDTPWSVITGLSTLYQAKHGGEPFYMAGLLSSNTHLSLGSASHICTTYSKPYGCSRYAYAPLDALLRLDDKHRFDRQAIEEIKVETHGIPPEIEGLAYQEEVDKVQHSIRHCLALAFLEGPEFLLPIMTDTLTDEVSALVKKIKIDNATQLEGTLARVTVIYNGTSFESEVTAARGGPTTPLSWEDLKEKFGSVIGEAAGDRIGEMLTSKDEQDQILSAFESFKKDNDLTHLFRVCKINLLAR